MDKKRTNKLHFDEAKCVSCIDVICVGVCPQGILEKGSDKKPHLTDAASCTLCGVCVNLCPSKAITMKAN